MKIIFMIPSLDYTGAPKMMAWISNQMAQKGYDVKFVTFFSSQQERALNENVEFISFGLTRSKNRFIRNTLGMIKIISKLDKYVKNERPDILVSFLDSVSCMYLRKARKRCNVVISERGDPNTYKGIISKIRFWSMKFADLTVFQTEGARAFFKDKYGIYEQSTVIPNPVVLTDEVKKLQIKIPNFQDRDNKIVTVGRLSFNQKRQDVLLKAFEIVHKKHPELELVIYGDGGDEEKLQELVSQLRLDKCVTLAGKVLGVEKEILNAKVFVLTSDYEGIPNALIEALSVGVPCVSTDCSPGGAKLLINSGENGFLVPCGDIKGIAKSILTLVENEEFSEKFSKASVEIENDFSEKKIADMWYKALNDTVEGGAKNDRG